MTIDSEVLSAMYQTKVLKEKALSGNYPIGYSLNCLEIANKMDSLIFEILIMNEDLVQTGISADYLLAQYTEDSTMEEE